MINQMVFICVFVDRLSVTKLFRNMKRVILGITCMKFEHVSVNIIKTFRNRYIYSCYQQLWASKKNTFFIFFYAYSYLAELGIRINICYLPAVRKITLSYRHQWEMATLDNFIIYNSLMVLYLNLESLQFQVPGA